MRIKTLKERKRKFTCDFRQLYILPKYLVLFFFHSHFGNSTLAYFSQECCYDGRTRSASRNVCHCFPHLLTSLSLWHARVSNRLVDLLDQGPLSHIQYTWCCTCCRISLCCVGINIYWKSADSCVFLAWGITSHPQCHSLWRDGRIYKQEAHIHRVLNLLGASQMQIQCCRYIIRGPGLTN